MNKANPYHKEFKHYALRLIAGAIIVTSVGTLVAGWFLYSSEFDIVANTPLIDRLIALDLMLLTLLSGFLLYRLLRLWRGWRRNHAGARLHVRLVLLFLLLTVAPAFLIGVLSYIFMELGVNAWFSERTRTALTQSNQVAAAYLEEHQRNIAADALRIARDINNDENLKRGQLNLLDRILGIHTRLRDISEAIIFDPHSGTVLARAGITMLLELDPVPQDTIDQVQSGEVLILDTPYDDRVRALIRLDSVENGLLYIGRLVDQNVLNSIEQTEGAVAAYQELYANLPKIRLSFALNFALIGALLLSGGIWLGLVLARRISTPLSNLIEATGQISTGEYGVRVPPPQTAGIEELHQLNSAFNQMAIELQDQRGALLEVNQSLEERRQFMEAVLYGVSSGIIGLDQGQKIDICNRMAEQLLSLPLEQLHGKRLEDFYPEFAPLLAEARKLTTQKLIETQLDLKINGQMQKFSIRIVGEQFLSIPDQDLRPAPFLGYVVTIDDIGPLMDAQRQAAWSDVARRIAHEIKNPLTPIQLAAERLERRYLPQIKEGEATYQTLLATIIRQVGDIQRMVDSFSSFARMPRPQFSQFDLSDLIRQAVFLQQSAHPKIRFKADLPDESMVFIGDSNLLSQLFNNLLKNAVEAITARTDSQKFEPQIDLTIHQTDSHINIYLIDNGIGLPDDVDPRRLSDPYVTSRERGTGLGLAIVRKIIEDHGGYLTLESREDGKMGTCVHFSLSTTLESEASQQDI